MRKLSSLQSQSLTNKTGFISIETRKIAHGHMFDILRLKSGVLEESEQKSIGLFSVFFWTTDTLLVGNV